MGFETETGVTANSHSQMDEFTFRGSSKGVRLPEVERSFNDQPLFYVFASNIEVP